MQVYYYIKIMLINSIILHGCAITEYSSFCQGHIQEFTVQYEKYAR